MTGHIDTDTCPGNLLKNRGFHHTIASSGEQILIPVEYPLFPILTGTINPRRNRSGPTVPFRVSQQIRASKVVPAQTLLLEHPTEQGFEGSEGVLSFQLGDHVGNLLLTESPDIDRHQVNSRLTTAPSESLDVIRVLGLRCLKHRNQIQPGRPGNIGLRETALHHMKIVSEKNPCFFTGVLQQPVIYTL